MLSLWQNRPTTPSNEKLLHALKIDEADLDANRTGLLTEHQRQLLKRRNRWDMIWNIFSTSGVWVATWWLVTHETRAEPVFVVWSILFALGLLYVLKDQFDLYRDWQQGTVAVTSGVIRRHAGRGTRSIVVLDTKQSFAVTYKTFRAFANGQEYVLYYTPRSKRLVAAEWVGSTHT